MHDLPPLPWLRAFEVSARHLSFTSAAQELALSHAAVSKQIKLLELKLGEPLFFRFPRSLGLPKPARLFCRKCRTRLSGWRQGPVKSSARAEAMC